MTEKAKQVHYQDQMTIESRLGNGVRMTWQSSFAKVNHPLAIGTCYFTVKSIVCGENPLQTSTQICVQIINHFKDRQIKANKHEDLRW